LYFLRFSPLSHTTRLAPHRDRNRVDAVGAGARRGPATTSSSASSDIRVLDFLEHHAQQSRPSALDRVLRARVQQSA